MQLSASPIAQFFIQKEFHQVTLDEQSLIFSSIGQELTIPFSAWNGDITISPGMIWDDLYFHAHEENDRQIQWLVQGLPKDQSRTFSQQASDCYKAWQQQQSVVIKEFLPTWLRQLQDIINQPYYLTHSSIDYWTRGIHADLDEKGFLLSDVIHLFPSLTEDERLEASPEFLLMSGMKKWLTHPKESIENRNNIWLTQTSQEWARYFAQAERLPLNSSQQKAVLLGDDHTLILAGAGSGKTSVIMARIGYLLQSGQMQAEQILLLAFSKEAVKEMEERLQKRFGAAAKSIQVMTFHQLGMQVIKEVEGDAELSPLVLNSAPRITWLSEWLKGHWLTKNNFLRWKKHLQQWQIGFLHGDVDLSSQVENPKLLSWLAEQVDQLCAMQKKRTDIQQSLLKEDDYARLASELALAWPCYKAWQEMLKEKNHLDFHQMIYKATQYIEKGKYKPQWRTVMVDEYQDISPARLQLLEAICYHSKAKVQLKDTELMLPCSLFAVGDDWQSIYSFAGADVNLTTGFERRFPNAQVHSLDTTYRFNNQLSTVANRFIQVNPKQRGKLLNSHQYKQQKCVSVGDMANLEKILLKLNSEQANPIPSVLILGRNNYHRPETFKDWQKTYRNLIIDFKTCHASKGQEADYVFIVSVNDGQFPMVNKQFHLRDALLKRDSFPFAEERRLFYVALTRAKKHVWALHHEKPSPFIKELRSGRYPVELLK